MTLVFVALAVGAFLIGLSKGGLGGAIGALVTPLLALVMPVPIALGLALPMLLIGDCFALYAHWDGWDKRIVWAILPSTVVGVVIAGLLLDVLTPALLHVGWGWLRCSIPPTSCGSGSVNGFRSRAYRVGWCI